MTIADFVTALRRINGEWCGVALYGGDHFTATLFATAWVVQMRVRDVAGERTYIVGEGPTLDVAISDLARKMERAA